MMADGARAEWAGPLVSRSAAPIAGYLGALFVAELLVGQGGFLIGGISHLLLLIALLVHYVATERETYRPLLLALCLPSLMRLASLTVTVVELPEVLWYVLIGLPTLLATLLVLRVVPVRLASLLTTRGAPLQAVVAVGGGVHGLLLYLIFRPAAIVSIADPGRALVAAIVLLVFVAIMEEVVFRGVVQGVLLHVTGSPTVAVVVSGAVYGCLFVSASSPLVPLVMLVVGIVFGAITALTGSLWGVIGAHALMTIGLLIVWPAMLP